MSDWVCHLADRRREAGISLTALAAQVDVSRQALTAIEAGRSAPSTPLALKLAGALGCRVEDLFRLASGPMEQRFPELAGSRVVLGEVSGRWVAHPLGPTVPRPADALVDAEGGIELLVDPAILGGATLVAGCAPALGVLAGRSRATWLHAGSTTALDWLASGRVHVAGMHLADHDAPAVHDALLRERLAGEIEVVTLHVWREGLVSAPHDPLDLAGLSAPSLRIARRPAGSGASRVLDRALGAAGAPPARGPLVETHDDAARAVLLGAADAAVVIEPVAQAFGLPFLPLSEERFELFVRTEHLDLPGVAALLDTLAGAPFAREIRGMGPYDLTLAGSRRRVAA
ncbi:MAG: helix-turn-helix domain-containing protein [Alphaproteobacteria bacterium]|nr:helix-turn-helix domain-containing protein [Alphaproteobacteria bacterium]